MAEAYDSVSEPIPISLIAGRYLLFDVNVVTYLRRTHNICGSLIGGIPQAPQQNMFLGLPVELMPEEATLLVKKEIAYIVDDVAWHTQRFNTFEGEDRQKYLASLRSQGLKARKAAQIEARKRADRGLRMVVAKKAIDSDSGEEEGPDTSFEGTTDDASEALFDVDDRASSPTPSSTAFASSEPYALTPSTSYSPSSLPQNSSPAPDPPVGPGYPLFELLHSRGYFMMPGLRFGCNFNVYPGDPLRFHAHFLANAYDFDEEIPLLDLIGGGRLGTSVKKGFVIGGEDPDAEVDSGRKMRTFCIEWGGM
ncbi:SEN34 subunit of tRNA-splicing endonuclease [Stipitochalara longipes BDJ]|nr:SEN34 subunit of tRNA-splicing endonuclease [Stipitochalara longipes BDJ]